jgi:hypothetical protein
MENSVVIEVEKNVPINPFTRNLKIMYKNIPEATLLVFSTPPELEIKEEWFNKRKSKVAITIDLTDISIAVYEKRETPLDYDQRFRTLYINEDAEIDIGLSKGFLRADIFIEKDRINVLRQRLSYLH